MASNIRVTRLTRVLKTQKEFLKLVSNWSIVIYSNLAQNQAGSLGLLSPRVRADTRPDILWTFFGQGDLHFFYSGSAEISECFWHSFVKSPNFLEPASQCIYTFGDSFGNFLTTSGYFLPNFFNFNSTRLTRDSVFFN